MEVLARMCPDLVNVSTGQSWSSLPTSLPPYNSAEDLANRNGSQAQTFDMNSSALSGPVEKHLSATATEALYRFRRERELLDCGMGSRMQVNINLDERRLWCQMALISEDCTPHPLLALQPRFVEFEDVLRSRLKVQCKHSEIRFS